MYREDDWRRPGAARSDTKAPTGASGFEVGGFGWLVDPVGAVALRHSAPGAPATILGPIGGIGGDHQVIFCVRSAPAGADLQLGVCPRRSSPGARLGWCGAAVDMAGRLRIDGELHAHGLGPIRAGSEITVRVRHGLAYFRHGRAGPWNSKPAADPLLGYGGLPLAREAEILPAVCADTPGVEVSADFRLWVGNEPGFDLSPARTSLAWQISDDRLSATHVCVEDAPATLAGPAARQDGDHELRLRLDELPAGGAVQVGLSNGAHLLDNELGWKDSLGVGSDGLVRQGGLCTGVYIGPIREQEVVTLRVRDGLAYFRRGPSGPWNGDPAANPEAGGGGLPIRFDGPWRAAVYAERPGTTVTGDFMHWMERLPSGRLRSGPSHSCVGLFDQPPMPPNRDRARRMAG